MTKNKYNHKQDAKSIKHWYKIAATQIIILLLLSTLSIQWYVTNQLNNSTADINNHALTIDYLFQIEKELSSTDNLVSSYLLQSQQNIIARLQIKYSVIIESVNRLEAVNQSERLTHKPIYADLRADLIKLKNQTFKLLSEYREMNKRYPALAYARTTLKPLEQQFINTVNQALTASHLDKSLSNTHYYTDLIQVRALWQKLIAIFRLYLINKLTSISPEAFAIQIKNIKIYHTQLLKTLKAMQQHQAAGLLDFEHKQWIRELLSTAQHWQIAFNKTIKKINQTRSKHGQTIQLNSIQATRQSISKRLETIVELLADTSSKNTITVSSVAMNISLALWLITGFSFVIIIIFYKMFNRSILKPMISVTRAMQAQTSGDKIEQITSAKNQETENLIKAFTHLSDQIIARQARLEYQAMHDSLTRLPNRFFLEKQLKKFLRSAAMNANLCLMVLDLNRFKAINDSLGHHIGDQILLQTGYRIRQVLRPCDIIGRWGGDEYAIILPDASINQAIQTADAIVHALSSNFKIEKHCLFVGTSIGIAHFPTHAHNATTLLKYADTAMYVAKRNKHHFCIFSKSLQNISNHHIDLNDDLIEAINQHKLGLVLRPVYAINMNKYQGVEIAIQWQQANKRQVNTEDLISVAEYQGLILSLMQWLIQNALEQFSKFPNNIKPDWISIDLPSHSLSQQSFIDLLAKLITNANINPAQIELTVPENVIACNCRLLTQSLHKLNKLGTRLAIREYGMDNISATKLHELPIDSLKIHPTLIDTMLLNETNAIAVCSAITLAHNLGITVTATGIHDKESLDLLRILKADYAQGDLLAPPLPAKEFNHWLSHSKTSPAVIS